jgi:hypothetical protein
MAAKSLATPSAPPPNIKTIVRPILNGLQRPSALRAALHLDLAMRLKGAECLCLTMLDDDRISEVNRLIVFEEDS